MKPKETYFYELLIIDEAAKTDIATVKSLLMALSYSDRLWKKPLVKNATITDSALSISLSASIVPLSKPNEAAFKLLIESANQEKLDTFINALVQHAKKKLLFSSIQVSKDGVAATIVKQVAPLIEETGKIISEYLAKHDTIKGIDWLVESSKELSEAKKLTDELKKVLTAITKEQGVKKASPKATTKKDKPARKVNKTTPRPALKTKTQVSPPKAAEPQEEPIQKTTQVEPQEQKTHEVDVKSIQMPTKAEPEPEPKPAAKKDYSNEAFKMITENELLDELKIAESSSNSFIDLKEFVTDVLVPKGYASGPTFSLARMMSGKGLVEIYDTRDAAGMPVKAVKIQ